MFSLEKIVVPARITRMASVLMTLRASSLSLFPHQEKFSLTAPARPRYTDHRFRVSPIHEQSLAV